jgi:hypothetical protein
MTDQNTNKNKQSYITMRGFLRWPKLFEGEQDNGYNDRWEEVGGCYTADFYPATEEELQKYWDGGCSPVVLGHQILRSPGQDNFGKGDKELGIGSYFKFRKEHNAKVRKYSGPPYVFDWREAEDSTKLWEAPLLNDQKEVVLGEQLWNGAECYLKLSKWGDGDRAKIRIKSVAILDNPEGPPEETDEPRF